MGLSCSTSRNEKVRKSDVRSSQGSVKSSSTSKEAIDYCDSISLAAYMRTNQNGKFLSEQISKQRIQVDSIESLIQKIETKSELIIRCYNEFTNSALKIKQAILDFVQIIYPQYMTKEIADTPANKELITYQTMLILVETIVILNCLIDKNFDEESEIWWNEQYFKDRMELFPVPDKIVQENPIVRPIIRFILAMTLKIQQVMLIKNIPTTIANSTAIAHVHLTQFYNDMKLDFIKNVAEESVQKTEIQGVQEKK